MSAATAYSGVAMKTLDIPEFDVSLNSESDLRLVAVVAQMLEEEIVRSLRASRAFIELGWTPQVESILEKQELHRILLRSYRSEVRQRWNI